MPRTETEPTAAEDVARVGGTAQPSLLVTDPPYGIELDSEWRDRAGLNKHGRAEASYRKQRTEGHRNTTISSDTRADWSEAFALVPSLQIGYVWHASKFTREVLDGLLRIGFVHHQQIIWNKGRAVLTRTHYWFQHEPAWYVRKKNAPWYGKAGENSTVWEVASPKFILGGSQEAKYDHRAGPGGKGASRRLNSAIAMRDRRDRACLISSVRCDDEGSLPPATQGSRWPFEVFFRG